jgi:hypothetical protein
MASSPACYWPQATSLLLFFVFVFFPCDEAEISEISG